MTSEQLAEGLSRGMEALHDGWPGQAVDALAPVVASPELAQALDLQDVRARACSLYAQALLACGRTQQAALWAGTAMRILQRHPDLEGKQLVAQLQEEIEASDRAQGGALATLERHRVRALSLEQLLASAADADQRCELAVKKANAHLDEDLLIDAAAAATTALKLAERCASPRAKVLAHLTAARAKVAPASELLAAALAIADHSDDFNLVAAVARAARIHGVDLPKETIG